MSSDLGKVSAENDYNMASLQEAKERENVQNDIVSAGISNTKESVEVGQSGGLSQGGIATNSTPTLSPPSNAMSKSIDVDSYLDNFSDTTNALKTIYSSDEGDDDVSDDDVSGDDDVGDDDGDTPTTNESIWAIMDEAEEQGVRNAINMINATNQGTITESQVDSQATINAGEASADEITTEEDEAIVSGAIDVGTSAVCAGIGGASSGTEGATTGMQVGSNIGSSTGSAISAAIYKPEEASDETDKANYNAAASRASSVMSTFEGFQSENTTMLNDWFERKKDTNDLHTSLGSTVQNLSA